MTRFDLADDVWLVYVSGLRGPSPQLIPARPDALPFVEESLRPRVLAKLKLPAEARDKSFAELQILYPPPEVAIDG